MTDRTTHLRIQKNFVADSIDFYLTEEGRDHFALGSPVKLVEKDPHSAHMMDPTFRLSRNEAQLLIDELWRAGVRPTDAKDKTEVINAMKDHIRDLRGLVFKSGNNA